jgi:replicative superfamily II helicase
MVDFGKRLAQKHAAKLLEPTKIYDSLDRASDKGPLRPAQLAILNDWHSSLRQQQDIIVKLHTGQGKTLIGLLMLQSKLNENGQPALYLCPNNFLVNQTCFQAKLFGVAYCSAEDDLPADFTEGKSILITSVHKLFNGLTKFRLEPQSIPVSTVLMDDCHACIDVIRDCFTIRLQRDDAVYQQLLALFQEALEFQGAGTQIDIKNGNADAFSPVPYWSWKDKQPEILSILGKNTNHPPIKFAWQLLKNSLEYCQCIISGGILEISPYLPPLEKFGSYYKASHRIFMSATVTDDSFLVKGLRLAAETIQKPLVFKDEKWSGEKMVLIPSMIHEGLTRSLVITALAGHTPGRKYGVVALVPSFKTADSWKAQGAIVAKKDTIESEIEKLRKGKLENTLVIANRYDGIDLPDETCRILIMDSKPYSDNLSDRYNEWCRPTSEAIAIRTARTIEQGLGRSVRGEKDYSVIVFLGAELVKIIRNQASRKYLSNQTRQQIEIGLEIAEMAKEDNKDKTGPLDVFGNLIGQCLKRDPNWKAFYIEKMDAIPQNAVALNALHVFSLELDAETQFQQGHPQEAIKIVQRIVDEHTDDEGDRSWYLQEMARYMVVFDQTKANGLQVAAHAKNHFLLKPRSGMRVDRLEISQKRMANIISWIAIFEDYEEMSHSIEDTLARLEFGTKADRFELGFHELGKAMGFRCERPDKEWKEGPDNLWGIQDSQYLLVECKSEVLLDRTEIHKNETGQMNNSCAWFADNYSGASATRLMIIPTNKLGPGAGFNEDVNIMSDKELKKLRRNVRAFIEEFRNLNLKDLAEEHVQSLLNQHELSNNDILTGYSRSVRPN